MPDFEHNEILAFDSRTADPIRARRNLALDMLDELDQRHDLLLSEIDALAAKLDSILNVAKPTSKPEEQATAHP